jgi:hypothetical protein
MKHGNNRRHNDEEMTFEEINSYYTNQWVLVTETAWDTDGEPIKGVVEAHSRIREELVTPNRELHRQNPHTKTYTFYTGEQVPENLVVVL